MNIDKANEELKKERFIYHYPYYPKVDCDGDAILDGAYTLQDLKKIVEIMERNKD